MAATGHITDSAIIIVLFDDVDDEDDGVDELRGAPDEDTVCTSKEVVCFWLREADVALMSTSTDFASLAAGVPEMVRVPES
jgi:hypothetical protein